MVLNHPRPLKKHLTQWFCYYTSVLDNYWVTQKLPQIFTVIFRICIGKVAWFAVYICDNFWVTQYKGYIWRGSAVYF